MQEKLIQIAKEAGKALLRRKISSVISKEGHANFVTNVDCMVQEYLEKALLRLLPGSVFIGEEKEYQPLTDAPTWIVDPLDGTTNMIHDYRLSAVSIALCREKEPVIGLILQPFTRELFYAKKGKGAFLNGERIHVSETPFREALVAVGTAPYYEELEETGMAIATDFLHQCADIRRSGSAAMDLAFLACGRHEVFYEMRLKPWDYAAGTLLVREAGGIVTMPMEAGGIVTMPMEKEMSFDLTAGVLAATPVCMDPALKVLQQHLNLQQ